MANVIKFIHTPPATQLFFYRIVFPFSEYCNCFRALAVTLSIACLRIDSSTFQTCQIRNTSSCNCVSVCMQYKSTFSKFGDSSDLVRRHHILSTRTLTQCQYSSPLSMIQFGGIFKLFDFVRLMTPHTNPGLRCSMASNHFAMCFVEKNSGDLSKKNINLD